MKLRIVNAFASTSLFVLIAVLSSDITCCFAAPTQADGERAIQGEIDTTSSGRIKLVSFKKTDAIEGEFQGIKFYSLEFQAEIEFLENCRWINYPGQMTLSTTKLSASAPATSQLFETIRNPGLDASKGQRATLVGAVRFIKKESGWVAENVQLSKGQLGEAPPSAIGATPAELAPLQPAGADKAILSALAEADRQYTLNFTPKPESGELQRVTKYGGCGIRFVKFNDKENTIRAVLTEISDFAGNNAIPLFGRLNGDQLLLQSENGSGTSMTFTLHQSANQVPGQFHSGDSSGKAEIGFGLYYLVDEDPKITESLFWLKSRMFDVYKASIYSNDITYFPALTPLTDNRFIYIPGLSTKPLDFPKDKRMIVFQKPQPSFRVIPIACLDGVISKVSPEELERRVKEQSGKSVAELIDADSSAKATVTAAGWKEFDKLTPSNPQMQQALSFTTRGIKLGDALSEVKKMLPGIQPLVSTNSISTDNVETEGTWVVKRDQGLQDAEFVNIELRGGRVSRMFINYHQEDANKLGGWQAALNSMKEKFGEPDADSRGVQEKNGATTVSYRWLMPESYRYITFLFTSGPKFFIAVGAEFTRFSDPTRLPYRSSTSRTGQGADTASRAASSRTTFESLTATLPDVGLFPKHVTEYALPYDKVWEAASQALTQQKETILSSEKEKGVLMTDLTRHSVIGIPSYERYCLLLEKQNDSSTKMTFILQTYLRNILATKGSANELKAGSQDLVNVKTKQFLGKIEQNLRKNR